MRSAIFHCAFVLGVTLSAAAFTSVVCAQEQPTPGTTIIKIDTRKTAGYTVPRSIYGTFLEPIGNSTYNGLWAELLQNPSFEDSLWDVKHIAEITKDDPALSRASEMALPLPWEPLRYAQGSRYAPQWNDAANSYRSLLLMALPGQSRDGESRDGENKDGKNKDDKQTGIRQKVYLPVHRISHFVGSVYLKLLSGPARVEVSLRERNNPDKCFSSREIQLNSSQWQRYQFSLDVPPGQIWPLRARRLRHRRK